MSFDYWTGDIMKLLRWFGGKKVPDNTPVEVPLQFKRPPSIQEEIQRFIRVETSRAAELAGFETWEESQDFGVVDDDPLTPYEALDMEEEELYDVHKAAVKSAAEAKMMEAYKRRYGHGEARSGQENGRDSAGRKGSGSVARGKDDSDAGVGGVGSAVETGDSKGAGAGSR